VVAELPEAIGPDEVAVAELPGIDAELVAAVLPEINGADDEVSFDDMKTSVELLYHRRWAVEIVNSRAISKVIFVRHFLFCFLMSMALIGLRQCLYVVLYESNCSGVRMTPKA
jgi:hypothetical protein